MWATGALVTAGQPVASLLSMHLMLLLPLLQGSPILGLGGMPPPDCPLVVSQGPFAVSCGSQSSQSIEQCTA